MKKLSKIISVLIIVAMIFMAIASVVLAADESAAPDPSGFTGNPSTDVNGITDVGNKVVTIVSTIGSIVSVIVLVVLGLKYMIGSAEEKAEYKKTLLPYVIGAALVFAASSIAGVIYGFTKGF